MHRYFNKCPRCGANLDPGERCTCNEEKQKKERKKPDLFYDLLAEQQEHNR